MKIRAMSDAKNSVVNDEKIENQGDQWWKKLLVWLNKVIVFENINGELWKNFSW